MLEAVQDIAPENISDRQRWMGVLARASKEELETFWKIHGQGLKYDLPRKPECGLVMVRGRAGGRGQRFNVGEVIVTRCSVRLADGTVGHAYVIGRDQVHSELAAAFDALLQNPSLNKGLMSNVILPLEQKHRIACRERSKKVAATKVDFFTMVRGEDE